MNRGLDKECEKPKESFAAGERHTHHAGRRHSRHAGLEALARLREWYSAEHVFETAALRNRRVLSKLHRLAHTTRVERVLWVKSGEFV